MVNVLDVENPFDGEDPVWEAVADIIVQVMEQRTSAPLRGVNTASSLAPRNPTEFYWRGIFIDHVHDYMALGGSRGVRWGK